MLLKIKKIVVQQQSILYKTGRFLILSFMNRLVRAKLPSDFSIRSNQIKIKHKGIKFGIFFDPKESVFVSEPIKNTEIKRELSFKSSKLV